MQSQTQFQPPQQQCAPRKPIPASSACTHTPSSSSGHPIMYSEFQLQPAAAPASSDYQACPFQVPKSVPPVQMQPPPPAPEFPLGCGQHPMHSEFQLQRQPAAAAQVSYEVPSSRLADVCPPPPPIQGLSLGQGQHPVHSEFQLQRNPAAATPALPPDEPCCYQQPSAYLIPDDIQV